MAIIIEGGAMVAAGLLLTFTKCSWAMRMKMLSNPLFMDVLVFTTLTLIHWGSFSGVMIASIGAMICSGLLSLGRYTFGHIDKGVYYPGVRNISSKLIKE
jgi:hypothetical protein